MERAWKGGLIGGGVGGIYVLIGIYYSIALGFVGYSCPFKIDSWVAFIFYPIFFLGCLPFFGNTGIIGFFVYSLLLILIFVFVGIFVGKYCEKKL
ncbi:MAG: hypothetical protein V1889_02145 [archaeon]